MEERDRAKLFAETGADAVFVETDFLRRYLTGFYSTDGYVILDENGCCFFADLRYFEAAERELRGSGVEVKEGGFREALARLEGKKHIAVPYPFTDLSLSGKLTSCGKELCDCLPVLSHAMRYKTADELARIRHACEIAEDAFLSLLPNIKEGMAEFEVAALLEYEMRKLGADGVSFETIVAFGENGSVPHHGTGSRKLAFGDPVLIDFGCKWKGYCSDCTRTFLFGDDGKHGEFKELYAHVLEAHDLVREKTVSGMTGKEADAIAREHLAAFGLDKFFTHSLGHGIGLQIHESPMLSPHSTDILEDGMVFSDEPGVYIAGKTGIRIEDSMYMEGGRTHSFMKKTQKNLLVL